MRQPYGARAAHIQQARAANLPTGRSETIRFFEDGPRRPSKSAGKKPRLLDRVRHNHRRIVA
jgi:hypothetical protein